MFKHLTSLLLLAALAANVRAQTSTATNFAAYDCAGDFYTLFDELDSGKIVVLNWVMPCVGCVGPTETSYNVAQNFGTLYPNKIRYFLIDDYGNTDCATFADWISSNGLGNKMKIFSDSTILWSDYGAYSMPKIVIIGSDHLIYYNDIGASAGAQAEMNAAFAAALGISNVNDETIFSSLSVRPLLNGNVAVEYALARNETTHLQIVNAVGEMVYDANVGLQTVGEYRIELPLANASDGIYAVRLTTASGYVAQKFSVVR